MVKVMIYNLNFVFVLLVVNNALYMSDFVSNLLMVLCAALKLYWWNCKDRKEVLKGMNLLMRGVKWA